MAALWFGAMIAGPSAGTLSRPSVRIRQRKRIVGRRMARATV
jgi:hypothetical protein